MRAVASVQASLEPLVEPQAGEGAVLARAVGRTGLGSIFLDFICQLCLGDPGKPGSFRTGGPLFQGTVLERRLQPLPPEPQSLTHPLPFQQDREGFERRGSPGARSAPEQNACAVPRAGLRGGGPRAGGVRAPRGDVHRGSKEVLPAVPSAVHLKRKVCRLRGGRSCRGQAPRRSRSCLEFSQVPPTLQRPRLKSILG